MVIPVIIGAAAAYGGYVKYKEWYGNRRIVVCGLSGSGKTTVIRALTQIESLKLHNDTIVPQKIEYSRQNTSYSIWDTPGLDDFEKDALNNCTEPNNKLYESMMELKSKTSEGIHLIVFVVKQEDLASKRVKRQYQLYASVMSAHVPVVLVVTHCKKSVVTVCGNSDTPIQAYDMSFACCLNIEGDSIPTATANKLWGLIDTYIADKYIKHTGHSDDETKFKIFDLYEAYVDDGMTRSFVV